MRGPYEDQKSFHRRADEGRCRNRLANPFIRARERRLAALVAGKLDGGRGRVLEIGCGEGANLHFLGEALPGAELVGLDFSEAKVALAKGQAALRGAVCGDALNLPFASGSFDLVLMRDLLHHVHWARDEALTEAMRALKPGGVVVIVESDGRKLMNRLFRLMVPAERGMAWNTPGNLRGLCERLGEVRLEFVEASFLARALGYVLGWSDAGAAKAVLRPAYLFAEAWERLMELVLPRSRWTYMLLSLRARPGR